MLLAFSGRNILRVPREVIGLRLRRFSTGHGNNTVDLVVAEWRECPLAFDQTTILLLL